MSMSLSCVFSTSFTTAINQSPRASVLCLSAFWCGFKGFLVLLSTFDAVHGQWRTWEQQWNTQTERSERNRREGSIFHLFVFNHFVCFAEHVQNMTNLLVGELSLVDCAHHQTESQFWTGSRSFSCFVPTQARKAPRVYFSRSFTSIRACVRWAGAKLVPSYKFSFSKAYKLFAHVLKCTVISFSPALLSLSLYRRLCLNIYH